MTPPQQPDLITELQVVVDQLREKAKATEDPMKSAVASGIEYAIRIIRSRPHTPAPDV